MNLGKVDYGPNPALHPEIIERQQWAESDTTSAKALCLLPPLSGEGVFLTSKQTPSHGISST